MDYDVSLFVVDTNSYCVVYEELEAIEFPMAFYIRFPAEKFWNMPMQSYDGIVVTMMYYPAKHKIELTCAMPDGRESTNTYDPDDTEYRILSNIAELHCWNYFGEPALYFIYDTEDKQHGYNRKRTVKDIMKGFLE